MRIPLDLMLLTDRDVHALLLSDERRATRARCAGNRRLARLLEASVSDAACEELRRGQADVDSTDGAGHSPSVLCR